MKPQIHNIWRPDTGILDIEQPWRELAFSEVGSLSIIWREQQERLKGTQTLAKFMEQLSREWAIETGIIENLYQIDRGITRTLIERGFHAEFLAHGSTNKPNSYVINLLRDQQDALDGVFAFIRQERPLSTSYIKELHAALVRSQNTTEAFDPSGRLIEVPLIKGDWKKQPNSPSRDGLEFRYCPPEQIASEMDRLVDLHLKHLKQGVSAEVEAAWLHHRFSQIHPFQDGNGRVCRALASLVLIRDGLFPLVVSRDDKTKYLDALETADQGNLKPLIELFVTLQKAQFRKATALSETLISSGSSVAQALEGLKRIATDSRGTRESEQQKVFGLSRELENDTSTALRTLLPGLQEVLLRLDTTASSNVATADNTNRHFFRSQIVENARDHLRYFADTQSYRSWVMLKMVWERQARLVLTFHGIGRPFSGSLVCAPFLEFRDAGPDGENRSMLIPVAEEPFVFFYRDELSDLLGRFRPWRERVLLVAISELGKTW